MITKWLDDLKGEERKRFEENVLGSKNVLDKLQNIVYNMIQSREAVNTNDYDSASWSHKQAHHNGYTEALRDVIKIIQV